MTPIPKSEARVALYARVSTNGNGLADGQTTDTQLHELHRHCEYKRWNIVGEYVDQGVSGSKTSRPALDRLMADAKQHKFDVILIWRFDRLGRNTKHLLECLELFKKLGIEFVSMSEQIDTSTPHGEFFFTVLAALARMERQLVGERVKARHRLNKQRGIVPGPKRKVKITDAEVNRRYAAGETLTAIARSVGCSTALLSRRLKTIKLT